MMKLFPLFVLITLLNFTFAYNPFGSTTKSVVVPTVNDQDGQNNSALQVNYGRLLDSRSRMPEIYEKALQKIKQLEEKPLCHRVAAQLSLNSCSDSEDYLEKTDQSSNAHLQSHKTDCFTLALTMCGLESGGMVIPDACTPFNSSVLSEISLSDGKFEVSIQEKDTCTKALAYPNSPSQYWDTYLSNIKTAMLFCQAARIDIEKDQYIILHQKMAKIIAEFSQGVEDDLRKTKEKMDEHTRNADSYFEGLVNQAEHLKANLRGTFETLSGDVKGATSSVMGVVGGMGDVQRLLNNLRDIFLQTNAEMAAEHEHALALTTNGSISSLERIKEAAETSESSAARTNELLSFLVAKVGTVQNQYVAMEESVKTMQSNFTNMSKALQVHTEKIEHTASTISGINENLETALASSKSLRDRLGEGGFELGLRIVAPIATMALGNLRLGPNLALNIVFYMVGLLLGEVLVWLVSRDMLRYFAWLLPKHAMPSAFTHLARQQNVSSISTTPFEELISATMTTSATIPTPHVEMA